MKPRKRPMTKSESMARVKAKNTSVELMLRRELWKRGIRYRTNDRTVFGTPDIVFKGKKIAVFIDSEFWHGKDFLEGKNVPRSNNEFWVNKLLRNIERDKKVNQTLSESGWIVIRFWTRDLRKNLSEIADHIERALKKD